jgi:hypothetical protein
MRLEILTAEKIKTAIFWNLTVSEEFLGCIFRIATLNMGVTDPSTLLAPTCQATQKMRVFGHTKTLHKDPLNNAI